MPESEERWDSFEPLQRVQEGSVGLKDPLYELELTPSHQILQRWVPKAGLGLGASHRLQITQASE